MSRSVNLLNKINLVEAPFSEEAPYSMEKKMNVTLKKRPTVEMNKKTPQEIAEEERKAKLEIKKQISQDYAKPFNPPSNISAGSYIIF